MFGLAVVGSIHDLPELVLGLNMRPSAHNERKQTQKGTNPAVAFWQTSQTGGICPTRGASTAFPAASFGSI